VYCVCTSGHKEGYSAPDEGDVWVHAVCRLTPRYVFDRITNMRVPYHAKSVASVFSMATGHNYVTFHMEDGTKTEVVFYHPYPFKDAPMTEQKDTLYKFWIDLDSVIDAIKMPGNDSTDSTHVELAKIRAKTLAEVLAYLMHKYYEDGTAVLRESQARWTARQQGVTDHQTPGLAEAIWDPATRHNGTHFSTESVRSTRAGGRPIASAPRPTGNRIPDTAIQSWTKGINEKMFTVDQCANTYKMTAAEVIAQLGLA